MTDHAAILRHQARCVRLFRLDGTIDAVALDAAADEIDCLRDLLATANRILDEYKESAIERARGAAQATVTRDKDAPVTSIQYCGQCWGVGDNHLPSCTIGGWAQPSTHGTRGK